MYLDSIEMITPDTELQSENLILSLARLKTLKILIDKFHVLLTVRRQRRIFITVGSIPHLFLQVFIAIWDDLVEDYNAERLHDSIICISEHEHFVWSR